MDNYKCKKGEDFVVYNRGIFYLWPHKSKVLIYRAIHLFHINISHYVSLMHRSSIIENLQRYSKYIARKYGFSDSVRGFVDLTIIKKFFFIEI